MIGGTQSSVQQASWICLRGSTYSRLACWASVYCSVRVAMSQRLAVKGRILCI